VHIGSVEAGPRVAAILSSLKPAGGWRFPCGSTWLTCCRGWRIGRLLRSRHSLRWRGNSIAKANLDTGRAQGWGWPKQSRSRHHPKGRNETPSPPCSATPAAAHSRGHTGQNPQQSGGPRPKSRCIPQTRHNPPKRTSKEESPRRNSQSQKKNISIPPKINNLNFSTPKDPCATC
jgi:hypothetical protein